MRSRPLPALALLLSLWPASPAAAQPLDPRAVPGPLQPWIPWALRGAEQERCPVFPADEDAEAAAPICAWAGELRLELGPGGGRFTQSWEIVAESDVPLPGDEHRR